MNQATAIPATGAGTSLFPCPNPRCILLVSADQLICTACNHSLGPCPICGNLMDKTIGLCVACGYHPVDPQATPVPSEGTPNPTTVETERLTAGALVVRFESERRVVTETLVEAYRRAAQAEADMLAAAPALGRAHSAFLNEADAFCLWELLAREVGKADSRSLRPVLVFLREWFEEQLFTRERERLRDLLRRDKEVGWREWLTTFAEGLGRWRLVLCQAILDVAESFPEQFRTPHDFKRATQLIVHERWTEVHQFFKYLAEQEFLPPRTRARLFVTVGQIHLYHFQFLEQALDFFRRSEALAPDESYVLSALGSYYQERNDLATARKYFDRAIQAAPGRPDGYVGMGDLAEKEGKYEEARSWFQKAISRASFDSLSYTRLLRLYARPGYIKNCEPYISFLVDRAAAVDETAEYSIDIAVGDAYASSERYTEARSWYQKAIDLDQSRFRGYVSLGQAYFNEGADKYNAAEQAFRNSVAVAPESYLGYEQLALLYEQEQKWEKAAEYYAQVIQRQPEFRPSVLAQIGEIQLKMGKEHEAENTLFQALRLDPAADTGTLFELAERYDKAGETAEALRVHEQIRQIKGDSYEASYRNRLGNFFYSKTEYEVAAQHYSLAIRADEKVTIYYSNLVEAFRQSSDWTRIQELWEQSPEDIQQAKDFRASLSLARNQEANRYYERREYAAASKLYMEAIKFNPGYAVLYSNLADAWKHNQEKWPDEAAKELGTAIDTLRQVRELAPDNTEYSEQLTNLEDLQALVLLGYSGRALESPSSTPIVVEVGNALVPKVDSRQDQGMFLYQLVPEMRSRIERETGIPIPGLRMRGSYEISSNAIKIFLNEAPIEAIIFPADVEASALIEAIERVLRRNCAVFVGIDEAESILDKWLSETNVPEFVRAQKDDPNFRFGLCRLLRTLARERIPISNLQAIGESIEGHTLAPADIPEAVRLVRLKLRERLPGNLPGVCPDPLSPEIESKLTRGLKGSATGYSVDPELAHEVVRQICALEARSMGPLALVVTDPLIRALLSRMIEYQLPEVVVLSQAELNPANFAPPSGVGHV